MKLARLVLALLATAWAAAADASSQRTAPAEDGPHPVASPAQRSASVDEQGDLTRERTLVEEARVLVQSVELARAREKAAEAVHLLLSREETERDRAWLELLDRAGRAAWDAQDPATAASAWQAVLGVLSRTQADDHRDVQLARQRYALAIKKLGDLAGARALEEKVLEVRSRTLPDDHRDLQAARANLAGTIRALGDLAGARALEEKVFEVRSRTLPDDHPDLQMARNNLALTLEKQGDLPGARALQEKVLAVFSCTLPDDHRDLQVARRNLAITIKALGDLAGAREIEEKVLEILSRILPDDHLDLQKARQSLAVTIRTFGDLAGARALEEKVLAVRSRTLPDDHPDLQAARNNLALTIKALGDLAGARALEEQVLAVRSRTLPDDHPDLQESRNNLASTIKALGDLAGARALQEKVLAIRSRTLPGDHPNLQTARLNLASTIKKLGDLAGARALEEEAIEVLSRTLPDDHPHLQTARLNLALTLKASGDLAGARALGEAVLEVRSRTLPDDHPALQAARLNLAWTLAAGMAHASGARGEAGQMIGERDRCIELIDDLCRGQTEAAREALLGSSAREAEARCERLGANLSTALSFASGLGFFAPSPDLEAASFVLGEVTRGAALGSAALMRRAAGTPRWMELREELRARAAELANLVQEEGATSEGFHQLLARREAAERELAALAREASGGQVPWLELEVETLSSALAERDAVVAYRRYTRWSLASPGPLEAVKSQGVAEDAPCVTSVESLCAFVVRPPGGRARDGAGRAALTRVELGPSEPIEAAVRSWRQAIGAELERGAPVRDDATEVSPRKAGEELRELVFDPLLDALDGAQRIALVLDDVLHLVPVDALPLDGVQDDGQSTMGDRLRFETRCTVTEVLAAAPPRAGAQGLMSLGGASFNSAPLLQGDKGLAALEVAEDVGLESALAGAQGAAILRGGAWERGFTPLTYTGLEAREVAALHDEVFGEDARSVVLEKRAASRAALEELAPRARWLHVATHGWFAPESVRSWRDPGPLDELSGLGQRLPGEEQVRGMSPMLLCGLALAGANLPADELGRTPGLITADELSTLDLSGCELAVLSACDTSVGERRAGQGVASLQRALQMAGARSVITSLWKVPDEATRELMLDFYRRLWVEGKPRSQALWEAKKRLREAKDERGLPRYRTRDWAAWVLTGEPD